MHSLKEELLGHIYFYCETMYRMIYASDQPLTTLAWNIIVLTLSARGSISDVRI